MMLLKENHAMPCLIKFAHVFLLIVFIAGCAPRESHRQALLDGIRALDSGRNEQASNLLKAAADRARSSAEQAVALNFLGVVQFRQNLFEQAEQAFRQSAQANPRMAAPLYNLAALADKEGREDDALALLDQAANAEPSSCAALEYAAAIHIRRQRWDMARAGLDKAYSLAPASPSVLTALALLEIQDGRPEDAIICLKKLLTRAPAYAPAIFNMAIAFDGIPDKGNQAASCYEQFLALSPPEPQAEFARAALAKHGHLPASKPGATPSIEPAPEHQMFLNNARSLASAKRAAAAVNLFLRAADVAQQAGFNSDARNAAIEAQNICPNEPEPRLLLAVYWLNHSEPAQAKLMAKAALATRPNWPDALLVLAKAAIAEKNYDNAIEALDRALACSQPNPDALWLRASIYSNTLNSPEKAIEDLKLFMEKFPSDPRATEAKTILSRLKSGRRRK